jgi:nucleoside 2-deoxyribosyltransferase
MKIYLAGPDVFLPDADVIGHRKREICARHDLIGLFPLDNNPPMVEGKGGLSQSIFRGNTQKMEEADAIIANLTPFRGPSADAGTIYELGFMIGRKKLCLGYSNLKSTYLENVHKWTSTKTDEAGRAWDANGMLIEDFGLADNLMIVHALEHFGYPLVTPDSVLSDPWRDLTVFEACVRLAADRSAQMAKKTTRLAL